MYYEERIINGILHHREIPGGRWIPFTIEELSSNLIKRKK